MPLKKEIEAGGPSRRLTQRKPTKEERFCVARNRRALRRSSGIGYFAARVVTWPLWLSAVWVGVCESVVAGLLLGLAGVFVFVLVRAKKGRVNSRLADTVTCGWLRCVTRKGSGGRGMVFCWAGPYQVYPWGEFWPEGETVYVELCRLVDTKGDSNEAILISLPGISVQALEFAGPPPKDKAALAFVAATLVVLSTFGAWFYAAGHGVSTARLTAAWQSPDVPPVASAWDLANREELRLQTVELRDAHRLSHPRSGSLVLGLSADEESVIRSIIDGTVRPSDSEVEQRMEDTHCVGQPMQRQRASDAGHWLSSKAAKELCAERAERELRFEYAGMDRKQRVGAAMDLISQGTITAVRENHGGGDLVLQKIDSEVGLVDEHGAWRAGELNSSLQLLRLPTLLLVLSVIVVRFARRSGARQARRIRLWSDRLEIAMRKLNKAKT